MCVVSMVAVKIKVLVLESGRHRCCMMFWSFGGRWEEIEIYIYKLLKKKWLVAPFQSDTQRAMITELFEGFKSTLSQISRQVSPTCE